MRLIFLILIFIGLHVNAQNSSCAALQGPRPDFYTLDEQDLFVITEYQETEYQEFQDQDSLNLPANLSSVNYYIDINGEADSSNVVDINYLYLQGYHDKTKTNGELFYLLSSKHIPMGNRKTNIRSEKSVDLYSELSSIVDMSFGYWELDTITHRVFIVFRERTKIWNMNNFRIFAGLILNKNIYLTKAMNTKDTYLFDYNFKRNKEVVVKLPLNLENVFYSEPVKTKDAAWLKGATLSRTDAEKIKQGKDLNNVKDGVEINKKYKEMDWSRTGDPYSTRNQYLDPQQKMTMTIKDQVKNDKTFNASIKYSYYPFNRINFENRKIEHMNYDALSFSFLKRKNKKRASKYILFKARKGDLFTYSKINVKQYKRYYWDNNLKEFIFIHVVDPYDEHIYHTFTIPYSGENFIPRMIYIFRKKIFNF